MKNLSIMIKPASSLCNLRCKYCFYADVSHMREVPSFGIMQPETTQAILDHIFADLTAGDSVTFAFQGGEPTVAGLDYFKHFVKCVSQQKGRVQVNYALQTNALVIDAEWCRFLKQHDFLVGVSLDGPPEFHDLCRVDPSGNGTFHRVMAAVKLLDQYNVPYNVLITLTNTMARHPKKLWQFIQDNHIQYVQFTPCLSPLGQPRGTDPYGLTPKRFCQFYQQIFSLWYQDFQKGLYTSIKFIDDLVNMLSYGQITSCGMNGHCSPQIVVESNGNVYPCDFYMLDSYCAGNLCTQNLREIYENPAMAAFRREPRDLTHCTKCPYLQICAGGCKRMQSTVCYAPGDLCCWYRSFLDSSIKELLQVAQNVKNPQFRLRNK